MGQPRVDARRPPLTANQLILLRRLHAWSEVPGGLATTARELAMALGMSQSSVTGFLDSLESRRLIVRAVTAKRGLALTAAGREAIGR